MTIKLTRADGSTFEAQIAPPTMSRRDALRAVNREQLAEGDKLDAKFEKTYSEVPEAEKYNARLKYTESVQVMAERYIVRYFKAIVNFAQLEGDDKKLFIENGKNIEAFWAEQDLHSMQEAIAFFRKN